MSARHEFCDHCEACRPAILDPATCKRLPDHDPIMVKVNKIWNTQTTYLERKAFIDVTVHNSRDPNTLRLAQAVVAKFELS